MSTPAEQPNLSRRFISTARLYGASTSQTFSQQRIVIIGIGGVGSWAAEALARSGIGKLTLVDLDHIAESNINRQIHALENTIGQAKITAMAQRIEQINPNCQLTLIDDFISPENCQDLIPNHADGIIDACDQFSAKLAIIELAQRYKIPFISVGAAGGKQLAHLVEIADISQASHDPLLAKIRYALRKKNPTKKTNSLKVPVVFSREPIIKPSAHCEFSQANTDANLNCHGYGSSIAVTATFGMCAAGWLLNRLSQQSTNS